MEKLLELIDNKIQEIENYAISKRRGYIHERYIHEINCLLERNLSLSLGKERLTNFSKKNKKKR